MITSNADSHPIHGLLRNDLNIVLKANSELARIWRLMLYRLKISTVQWEHFLQEYCARAREEVGDEGGSNLKGNLVKRLVLTDITWNNFCRGVSIFNFRKVTMSITMIDMDDSTQTCIFKIPFTIEEDRGDILADAWKRILNLHPEKVGRWDDLLNSFVINYQEFTGEDKGSNLKGNLSSALNGKELTWNTFNRGLIVLAFKKIRIELTVESSRNAFTIPLELGNTRSPEK